MESYRPYPCKQCGACCRHVNLAPEMQKYDSGNGTCINLQPNNRCKIYPNRPNICNGEYVYTHYYSTMTVSEFHHMIQNLCRQLRKEEVRERLSEDQSGC